MEEIQETVYNTCVASLVDSSLEGYFTVLFFFSNFFFTHNFAVDTTQLFWHTDRRVQVKLIQWDRVLM